jgi:hypothetical protein
MAQGQGSVRWSAPTLSPSRAILYGWLVVGTLDGLDAAIVSTLRGSNPERVFQYVASGLLGPSSMQGGAATALFGVLIHFFIAFCVVLTYNLASRRLRMLAERPLLYGPIYGVLVWLFMNFVVIPLSVIGVIRLSTFSIVNGLLIHIFGIGIPSALFASWMSDVRTGDPLPAPRPGGARIGA